MLVSLGFNRNAALFLVFLMGRSEATQRDVERATRLRQPEVSVASKRLAELGWVSIREQKKVGKGRPFKVYKLTVKLPEIIAYFESMKKREADVTKTNIEKLKILAMGE